MRKFLKGSTFGTNRMTLTMPREYRAKKLMVRRWYNPYTEKGAIKRELILSYESLWTGRDRRQNRMDLREETLLRDGPTCAKCGNTYYPSEVHVDHIILRAKFKDPTDADKLENFQVLCNDCHRAKTKTDLKVLSRMR
jgi:hypothetical protein